VEKVPDISSGARRPDLMHISVYVLTGLESVKQFVEGSKAQLLGAAASMLLAGLLVSGELLCETWPKAQEPRLHVCPTPLPPS